MAHDPKDIIALVEHSQQRISDLNERMLQSKEQFDEFMNECHWSAQGLLREYTYLSYQPAYQNMMHSMDQTDYLIVDFIRRLKESLRTISQELEDIKTRMIQNYLN